MKLLFIFAISFFIVHAGANKTWAIGFADINPNGIEELAILEMKIKEKARKVGADQLDCRLGSAFISKIFDEVLEMIDFATSLEVVDALEVFGKKVGKLDLLCSVANP